MSNLKNYKYDWVWNKENGGNFIHAKNRPISTLENIIVFSNKKHFYFPIMEKADMTKYRGERNQKQKQGEGIIGKISNGKFISKKGRNIKLRYPKSLLTFNSKKKELNALHRVHPTQKPVDLMEYLIKTYTNEEETVLDFTMGSGSTGVACKNTNRKFIGIEMDEKYFKIAEDRINKT